MRATMRLACLAAAGLFLTTLTAVPAGASPPLLWQGKVLGVDGRPVAADVVAALRPAPAALPTAEEFDAGQRGPEPIVLAAVRSGRDGRFELRAPLRNVPSEYRSGRWAHLMVSVAGSDGTWAMAFDSVRVTPDGRWASTDGGALPIEGQRPDLMRLAAAAPAAPGPFRPYAPGKPWVGCAAIYVEDRANANRTIADIDVARNWSFKIHYQETDTTAWQVGYSETGEKWSAGGSVSFDSARGAGFDADYGPYQDRFREHYQVNLVHAKIKWRCGGPNSPGPFYVSSVEPERWTGGTYNEGEPHVVCGRDVIAVAGNTVQWRSEGRSSRYSASGGAFGFSGTASVTYSKGVRLGWMNHDPKPRLLCGESGDPIFGNTRVRAIDF